MDVSKLLEPDKPETIEDPLDKFSHLFSELETPWEQLVDRSQPLSHQILSLLKRCVILPNGEIQYPLVGAYLMLPVKILRKAKSIIPLMFCYGQSGSGKSTVGFFAQGIYKGEILSSASTFAAVRNQLTDFQLESIYCLIWDDCSPRTFENEQIFVLCKCGYDPKSSIMKVAGKVPGENYSYDCYGPKIFSSIHPIHLKSDLNELARRMFVVLHKPVQHLEDPLLEVESIDFANMGLAVREFWDDAGNIANFIHNRKKLANIKTSLSLARIKAGLGLLAVATTVGLYASPKDAIRGYEAYWEFYDSEICINKSPLQTWLEQFISGSDCKKFHWPATRKFHLELPSKLLRDSLLAAYNNAEFDEKPSDDTVRSILNMMGFFLSDSVISSSKVWTKTLEA